MGHLWCRIYFIVPPKPTFRVLIPECPQAVGPNAYGIGNSDFPLDCIAI